MGGPALHVAYLSAGLADRGYDTTLVAGSLAVGEESMSGVAEELGVGIVTVPELHREISPLRDLRAVYHLAALIRDLRPQILHTHTAKAGTIGRLAAMLAGDAAPPIVVHTFHGHVLRGYFGPLRSNLFRLLERFLATRTTALVAVSPEVRDDLVALGVAPREKFTVVRLGIELEQRVGARGHAGERDRGPRRRAARRRDGRRRRGGRRARRRRRLPRRAGRRRRDGRPPRPSRQGRRPPPPDGRGGSRVGARALRRRASARRRRRALSDAAHRLTA